MEIRSSTKKPHAVLLSSPGLGHLIPVLELGKRLVTNLDFHVTIFVVASHTSAAESDIIKSAMTPNLCEIIELPSPDISGLVSPESKLVTIIRVIMRETRPALRSAISSLKSPSPPTVMIVDLFGTESLVIGEELQIPKYVYIASHAWFVALTVYVPTLDKIVKGEYVDRKDPLNIPGCMPVRPEDVVDPMLDRNDQHYFEYVRLGEEIKLSDGVLVNTWEDLQPTTLAALRDEKLLGRDVKGPIFPIGPIVRPLGLAGSSSNQLFDWLDKQPSESVVFVSFGSGGTLSSEQLTELAWGLELSQQRFIWVVRPPTVKSGDGSFFTAGTGDSDDLLSYLPEGFLTRTRKAGMVVPEWAPQVEILSHPSVGGFFSHCGWNSTLESMTNGVPMIVWPLYAEQRMNATLLTEELGVGVRSEKLQSNRVVGREEIKSMVRRVMGDEEEGNAIRRKVKEIKRSAERAQVEGGSSYNALSVFAKHCQSRPSKFLQLNAFDRDYGLT
ncbi:hypothetical protein LWI29_016565 [Acer saccharum]|uniref:Glycosyltransferase n=1 Tax=Acer saccharum TaxID=4024 RepID=A0AA39TH02_ACESA|nr:hypothetical protein LWI29_016565 [Acer saccharum]